MLFRSDERSDAIAYRPETEEGWRDYSGKEPGYYGRPTSSLVELGANLAADARFGDCAVRTVWEGLSQQTYTDDDWGNVQGLADVYDEAGGRLVPVVRAMVLSDEYRGGDRVGPVRTASPRQLASIIEDLTGYRWTFDGDEGLSVNDMGLPVLAGGRDDLFVTQRGYTPSLGAAFVQERLAQAAARHVAEHDLADGRSDDAILLAYVTSADTPESAPEAFDAQIRALYLRITGVPLAEDATEPARLAALWNQLHDIDGSATSAWAGVVSVVLRDPRVLFY